MILVFQVRDLKTRSWEARLSLLTMAYTSWRREKAQVPGSRFIIHFVTLVCIHPTCLEWWRERSDLVWLIIYLRLPNWPIHLNRSLTWPFTSSPCNVDQRNPFVPCTSDNGALLLPPECQRGRLITAFNHLHTHTYIRTISAVKTPKARNMHPGLLRTDRGEQVQRERQSGLLSCPWISGKLVWMAQHRPRVFTPKTEI